MKIFIISAILLAASCGTASACHRQQIQSVCGIQAVQFINVQPRRRVRGVQFINVQPRRRVQFIGVQPVRRGRFGVSIGCGGFF